MRPQHPLSSFVRPPEVSTAALQLEWHEVRRRLRRGRQRKVAAAVGAALAVVGLVAGLTLRAPHESFIPGQAIDTQEHGRTLWLAEGSEVSITEGSTVSLASADDSEVVLIVERGRASFDVQRRPRRRFVVKADGVEIRVVGTKFTVQRQGHDVAVSVMRGVVEVREGEVVRRLTAGALWSRAPKLTLEPEAEKTVAEDRGFEESSPPRPPTSPRYRQPSREPPESARGEGPAGDLVIPQPEAAADPPPVGPAGPTPADTFADAMRARRSGHAKEAMIGFQRVCERWPSSAYAPMAAFEWGRLALDSQDDARQAARAFERTLELATAPSLIEDTLARLTEAYARYDVSSCRRVQTEYLRRFPNGPYARGVSKACRP